MSKETNMLDYARAYGQDSLTERAFCPLDNLILSQLSYLDYAPAKDRLPCALQELIGCVDFGVMAEDNEALFLAAANSRRFSKSIVCNYVNAFSQAQTQQFAAVSFLLEDGSAFVSYRGTDSTLVGWKEDFMLSFTTPVPAQTRAVEYLNDFGRVFNCPLRVGGHSKGGNLAIYASIFCDRALQDRILQIYSNDGPGFEPKILALEEYRRIKERISCILPVSSAVGVLMESDSRRTVVDSTGFGLFQHNPYTWVTNGCAFVEKPSTGFASSFVSQSQKDWFRCLSEEKRRYYTDTLFDILSAGNPRTLKDIKNNPTQLLTAVRAARSLPEEDRANMLEFVKQLFSSLYAGGSAAAKLKYAETLEVLKAKLEKLESRNSDG